MAAEKKCCVPGCGLDGEILHKFPDPNKDTDRFRMWIYNVGGDILAKDNEYIYMYRRVCNLHFEARYHTRSKRLSRNAVPTLNLKSQQFQNKVKTVLPVKSLQETVPPVKSHNSMDSSKATDTKCTSYEKCCRTCLKEDFLMFNLFSERLESSNIADMLVSCSKLKIQKDDTLPKQICSDCFKCLKSFSHFCIMAQKAEDKLINSFCERDSIEIKIEINDHDYISGSHEENHHAILDENKNSELYNSYVSHDNCKAEEINEEKKKISRIDCNKYISNPSKLKHDQEKRLNKTERSELCIETKDNKNALPLMINEKKIDINVKKETDSDLACVLCSTNFDSMNLCSKHVKINEEEGAYSCKKCNEEYNNSSDLSHSEMIHNDQCSQINLSTIIPKKNVNMNISALNYNHFKCDKCFSSFKSIQSLSAHMKKHIEKGRILSCKVCNKVFKKLSHLKRHEMQHEYCPFKCSVCPKAFLTEDALDDHINKHRGEKPHQCPICSKRYSLLSSLATHIKIHTSEKFKLCPTCGKKFVSSTNLKQHMLRHSGLKNFACTFCPKRFVSKGELKLHTVTHTGERSYTCDQCGASFTSRSSLTKHIKILHLGMKPYQCKDCLMRFTCSDHFKRHNRIHTGEKPYKCDMCDRAFTQSNDLVKHRRSHLGDKVYICSQCNEGFRFKAELRQHLSEHFVSSQTLTQPMNVSKESSTDGVGSSNPLTTVIGGNDVVNICQTDNPV